MGNLQDYTIDEDEIDKWIIDLAAKTISNEEERLRAVELLQRVKSLCDCESIEDLLRNLNTSLDRNEQDRDAGKVNVMTMHQAKGLSADAVLIPASEKEYIPGRNTVDDERRLLFVSLTRAKHYLFVTHRSNRYGSQRHSGSASGKASRNLTEFLSGGPIQSINSNIYLNSLE